MSEWDDIAGQSSAGADQFLAALRSNADVQIAAAALALAIRGYFDMLVSIGVEPVDAAAHTGGACAGTIPYLLGGQP